MGLLFRNRFLLYHLVRRDIATRFVGSYAGLFWGLVHPLILLAVYSTLFVYILQVKMGSGVRQNFAEFLFCALWAWIAFSEGTLTSVKAVVGNPNLVKRMAFPLEVLAPSCIFSALLLQLLGFGLFMVYLLVFGKIPVWGIWRVLLVVVPLIFQCMFSVGLGWVLSALQVFVRDTAQFVAAAMTVWFFLTPIIYPADLVPAGFRFVIGLNPWTHLAEAYRCAVFQGTLPLTWGGAYVVVLSTVLFVFGGVVFEKLKPEFADAL